MARICRETVIGGVLLKNHAVHSPALLMTSAPKSEAAQVGARRKLTPIDIEILGQCDQVEAGLIATAIRDG